MPNATSFAGRGVGQAGTFRKTPHHSAYPRTARKSTSEAVYINTPQGRRQVGRIVTQDGQRIFEKDVIEAKHLHKRFDAWGVDAAIIDSLTREGVAWIRVLTDTGSVEEASVGTFALKGMRYDFGFGPQVFLPRKFFGRRQAGQTVLFGGGL